MKPFNQWSFVDIIEIAKHVDKKKWVAGGVGAVASLLILVFFVIPAWIERPLLRRDIQSMGGQIRQVNALSQKRLVWEENQKVFEALIEKTQARLFTADDLGVLLGQVSKRGSESRVEVLASKPAVEKNPFAAPYNLKYQPSAYEFTFQGGYHDLADFAGRIESNEKLLRIRSFQIVPSEKTPDKHIAELKLWAMLKVPAQAAAPAAGASNVKK